jgi:carbonic anhydrase/acetyltransferase-like protein (isoleucine patch superfamily)
MALLPAASLTIGATGSRFGDDGCMLIKHRGAAPSIDASAFVAPTATLVGDVRVGPRARIMYGAVLDAEGSRISIGEACIVAENAVLRATAVGDAERPVALDDHVFVGPHATLLGCTLERCVYIGTGATVLHGATVGAGAVVAVGALVHARTEVPSQFFVAPQTLAIGAPVRVLSPDQTDEVSAAIRNANFAGAAFGVEADWDDRIARYERTAEVRAAEFAAHRDDEILE